MSNIAFGGERARCCAACRFEIGRGEAYGLVGESGCGKSTAAYAVLRYLPRNGAVSDGRILVDGQDLMALDDRRLRELRRKSVAMVYQDPGRALNPSIRIGRQIAEVFELAGMPRAEWADGAARCWQRSASADPGG